MIATPSWLKKMVYSTTRPLSMGRIISSVQRIEMTSKESYLAAGQTAGIFGMKSPVSCNCRSVCPGTTRFAVRY